MIVRELPGRALATHGEEAAMGLLQLVAQVSFGELADSVEFGFQLLRHRLHLRSCHETRGDRELVGGKAHRSTGGLFLDARDLVDHAARANDGDPSFNGAFAASLTDLERLLGDRLVGGDANPELSASADVAGDGATAGP